MCSGLGANPLLILEAWYYLANQVRHRQAQVPVVGILPAELVEVLAPAPEKALLELLGLQKRGISTPRLCPEATRI